MSLGWFRKLKTFKVRRAIFVTVYGVLLAVTSMEQTNHRWHSNENSHMQTNGMFLNMFKWHPLFFLSSFFSFLVPPTPQHSQHITDWLGYYVSVHLFRSTCRLSVICEWVFEIFYRLHPTNEFVQLIAVWWLFEQLNLYAFQRGTYAYGRYHEMPVESFEF